MRGFVSHMFDPGWHASPARWIGIVWAVWALSWFAAAIWSRQTTARASYAQEMPYRIVTLIGVALLFGFIDLGFGQVWELSETGMSIMLALVVAGFVFAWWARLHLGALWSGTITRKQDHRIVDTGPYALVRHPIYTGLLLSGFATSIARGRSEALIGAFLFALGCWIKARQEERFLSEELGAEYAAYRKRVPMLVPFTGALG